MRKAQRLSSLVRRSEGIALIVDVNLDLIAPDHQNKLYVAGTYSTRSSSPTSRKLARIELVFGLGCPYPREQDWTYRSDNAYFHAVNIPFLYFLVGEHKDYHKSTNDSKPSTRISMLVR